MSFVRTNNRSSTESSENYGIGYPPVTMPRINRGSGPSWELLVTGIVVVGLGVMAWQYLGPDFKRYLKISNM